MADLNAPTPPSILWRGSAEDLSLEGLSLTPLRVRLEHNSAYVVDRNNGSLWGGRGTNGQVRLGAVYRQGPVAISVAPEINQQQNREFDMRAAAAPAIRSPFANAFYPNIDLPQRFGDDAYLNVFPGDSYVRVDVGPVGVGAGTESMWWGPGLRQAIVLSNTAPGFAHVFVETNRPIDVWLGDLGGSLFWGRLNESEYFDTIGGNDHRLMTGLGLTFRPRGLREVTLGVMRVYTIPWDSIDFRSLLPFFEPALKEQLSSPDNPRGNSDDDQRFSAFFHWKLPESGFEMYGEYGREDHAWDWEDFIQEPEHGGAYLIGLQKVHRVGTNAIRVQGEWVNLQQLRPNRGARATSVAYLHSPQGHTHEGQMLGAGIGPGSEAQYVTVELLAPGYAYGGFIERVRRDEFSSIARAAYETWPPRHDVETTVGVRGGYAFGVVMVSGQLSLSRRLNRNWVDDESNVRLVLQAEWAGQR